MASMRDGLGGEELTGSSLQTSGTGNDVLNPYFIGSVYSDTKIVSPEISGTNVNGTTISGTNIINTNGELQSVSIGSATSVFGAKIQAGSSAIGAGSSVWLEFPTSFNGNPTISVTNMTSVSSNNLTVHAGSVNPGSFYVEGETASDEFSWVAIGI